MVKHRILSSKKGVSVDWNSFYASDISGALSLSLFYSCEDYSSAKTAHIHVPGLQFVLPDDML